MTKRNREEIKQAYDFGKREHQIHPIKSVIRWGKDHKTEIVGGIIIVCLCGALVVVCKENSNLKATISALEDKIDIKDAIIWSKDRLCEEKDRYYKAMISEALRKGSSEGGRQMAFLKTYQRATA